MLHAPDSLRPLSAQGESTIIKILHRTIMDKLSPIDTSTTSLLYVVTCSGGWGVDELTSGWTCVHSTLGYIAFIVAHSS